MKCLSIGALAMDCVMECSELPKNDGFALVTKETLVPGGSAANVSVAAACFGVEVYQTGQVGKDQFGPVFCKTLEEDQVDASYVIQKDGRTTLHTYIMTVPGGEHCIFANLGDAVATLQKEDLPENLMDEMDIFYTDMFSSQASLHLGNCAKEQNKPIIYNMQCLPDFMESCGTSLEQIEKMLGMMSLLVTGQEGYFALSKEKDLRAAMKDVYERYHPKDGVICTMGAKGACWYDGSVFYEVPTYAVDVIDSTGAGDSFVGGLIYAYYDQQWSTEESLAFANGAAAIKCTQKGPRLKASKKEVIELKESQGTISK